MLRFVSFSRPRIFKKLSLCSVRHNELSQRNLSRYLSPSVLEKKWLFQSLEHNVDNKRRHNGVTLISSRAKHGPKQKHHHLNHTDFHNVRLQYPVVSSEGEDEHDYIRRLKEMDDFWMKNMSDLEELGMNVEIYTNLYTSFRKSYHFKKIVLEMAKIKTNWNYVKHLLPLSILRKTLFLHFRVTVTKVMEPLLTEKVPRVKEESKGGHLVDNHENINRMFDYSYFLKQLKMDVERGKLDYFFSENKLESGHEFYEICEYALQGDKDAFLIAHPEEVYYIEEEVSCSIKFPNEFDRDAIFQEVDKLDSEDIQEKCRRLAYNLEKLLPILK